MAAGASARRSVSRVLLVAGVAVVVVSLLNGFTSDPRSGEGWGGGVLAAVLAGGPLIAIGTALRSQNPSVARRTAAAAAGAAAVVAFVLVMQVLDENESAVNRAITFVALVMYVVAAAVEVPLARHRR